MRFPLTRAFADVICDDLASRNIVPIECDRANHRVKIEYDRTLYKLRNIIERMFDRQNINHTIFIQYDRLANSVIRLFHIATGFNSSHGTKHC